MTHEERLEAYIAERIAGLPSSYYNPRTIASLKIQARREFDNQGQEWTTKVFGQNPEEN